MTMNQLLSVPTISTWRMPAGGAAAPGRRRRVPTGWLVAADDVAGAGGG
jgi:hypothetical protein